MCRLNMLQHLLAHILKLVMQFLPLVKPSLSLFGYLLNLFNWHILRLKFGSQSNYHCSQTRDLILTLAIFKINLLASLWDSFKMLFFNCLRGIKRCCLCELNVDFTACSSLQNARHNFLREIKQSFRGFDFSILIVICWVLVFFAFVISDCFCNLYTKTN